MTPAPDIGALRDHAAAMADRLRILAHPERLTMLCRMSEGEMTVGQLVELSQLSQSAVSQHLARFREAGIVDVRRDAQTRHYRLADEDMRRLIQALCAVCDRFGEAPAEELRQPAGDKAT